VSFVDYTYFLNAFATLIYCYKSDLTTGITKIERKVGSLYLYCVKYSIITSKMFQIKVADLAHLEVVSSTPSLRTMQ
jgi:hypothetical protein